MCLFIEIMSNEKGFTSGCIILNRLATSGLVMGYMVKEEYSIKIPLNNFNIK